MLTQGYDVAIVGAGHNGLACAALLGKAGLSVAVFERAELLGGAAVSEPLWDGYTVSAASHLCTLLDPWLISELNLQRHGYSGYPKDPSTFNLLGDGRSLLLGADDRANALEIAAFDKDDVHGFIQAGNALRALGSTLSNTFRIRSHRSAAFPKACGAIFAGRPRNWRSVT